VPDYRARRVDKHLVILSEVAASQSEAATKSKDPIPASVARSAKRKSHDAPDAAGSFSKTRKTRIAMKPEKYWVYIVGSLTGTLYIGMTNNIDRRMAEHKSRAFDGFALKYHCDRLVYYESFDDVRKAIDREKQLKGWIRAKKTALITSINPT
jgi:putative endonuclease